MCLLIDHPADTAFDDADIVDFWKHNPDGVGVMYSELRADRQQHLVTARMIPTRAEDAVRFYHEFCKGRDCVLHFRLQTHGKIDLENCHPYWVFDKDYPIALMHNGILHTGNSADESMSDTWHYVQSYLRPLLKNDPGMFCTKAFIDVISEHIGTSNKFIMLDAYGNKAIMNESSFVSYKGAKLSNTYAWSCFKVTAQRIDFAFEDDRDAWCEDFFNMLAYTDSEMYDAMTYVDAEALYASLGDSAWPWLEEAEAGHLPAEVIQKDIDMYLLNQRLNRENIYGT